MSKNKITEWCQHCEDEVEIPDNKASSCPTCGKRILPCSECEMSCDWNEDIGCSRFPKGGD